jgi:hypothetical protein
LMMVKANSIYVVKMETNVLSSLHLMEETTLIPSESGYISLPV